MTLNKETPTTPTYPSILKIKQVFLLANISVNLVGIILTHYYYISQYHKTNWIISVLAMMIWTVQMSNCELLAAPMFQHLHVRHLQRQNENDNSPLTVTEKLCLIGMVCIIILALAFSIAAPTWAFHGVRP